MSARHNASGKTGYRAESRFIFASPYKIRPVADLVRRKSYPDAMAVLEHLPHRGAALLRKTVKSAAGNALDQNKKLAEDMLYVRDVQVNEGPRAKRIWFRARGRADMLLKRMCHITVVIDEVGK
ncbi:MAG: 50S ribosomal protein L22 [Treponema sp.]|jgi:large subunit ribosomal protein L22|nr:50S ribosomal protein L22 [Treponema sp.]